MIRDDRGNEVCCELDGFTGSAQASGDPSLHIKSIDTSRSMSRAVFKMFIRNGSALDPRRSSSTSTELAITAIGVRSSWLAMFRNVRSRLRKW